MLSWVSFWLNIDAAPARVSLGILTVLTISTNSNTNVGVAQQVSYIRAIDIWNVVCLCLVFGAMIEYAYVGVIARVQQRRKQEKLDSFSSMEMVKNRMVCQRVNNPQCCCIQHIECFSHKFLISFKCYVCAVLVLSS